jgi:hypothetical protein
MRFNIADLLEKLGITEPLYWGKRAVRALPQPGAFKSHAVVANWQQPHLIRLDLRAGLSGKTLNTKDLAHYPLQFQTETFFEFQVDNADDDGDQADDKKGSKGKAGSGGGATYKKKPDDHLAGFFARAQDRTVPTHARLTRGVVMGMEIGASALGNVFDLFCEQVRATKVLVTDLLASAGKVITRYTPPAFIAARGDEDKVYRYNREKNEPMFGVAPT